MFRKTSCLVLFLFIIWVMPLGAFINPANRDKACGGQRAICLCLKDFEKKDASRKVMMAAPGVSKEAASPGGSSHDFVVQMNKDIPALPSSRYFEPSLQMYTALICKSIEHIPKV